ncbi:MAG: methyltransferase domain-containing protein [Nanoarchaeota archaeon]|nr:methyltransferase domain-containing protein [Nanoarchaeota archaeon]
MKYILQLHQDLPELAKGEALALNPGEHKTFSNILLLETSSPYFKTLAFTKKSCQFLFQCKKENLQKTFKNYNWQKIYKESFAVRTNSKELKNKEKEFAEIVWAKINNPKVNLNSAKTPIEIFITEKYAFCGLLVHKNEDKHHDRHPNNRPAQHPSTLKPKLAKSLLNLSGLKKGKVLDPFCGTGGILLESALLNFKTIGYDLSPEMIKRCKKNIKHFNLNIDVKIKDATSKLEKVDLIVTDPPYGRASSVFKRDIIKLYEDFLKQAEKSTKKAVIIFPSILPFKKIIKTSNFTIEKIYKVKVHRSLTRNIVILKR